MLTSIFWFSSTKATSDFQNMATYERSCPQVGISRITIKAAHSDSWVLCYDLNHCGRSIIDFPAITHCNIFRNQTVDGEGKFGHRITATECLLEPRLQMEHIMNQELRKFLVSSGVNLNKC